MVACRTRAAAAGWAGCRPASSRRCGSRPRPIARPRARPKGCWRLALPWMVPCCTSLCALAAPGRRRRRAPSGWQSHARGGRARPRTAPARRGRPPPPGGRTGRVAPACRPARRGGADRRPLPDRQCAAAHPPGRRRYAGSWLGRRTTWLFRWAKECGSRSTPRGRRSQRGAIEAERGLASFVPAEAWEARGRGHQKLSPGSQSAVKFR